MTAKPKFCYLCETLIEENEGHVQLADGKTIKNECFEEFQEAMGGSKRLLRTAIEQYKQGKDISGIPDGTDKKQAQQLTEETKARMAAARAKAEEEAKKIEAEKAAKIAREMAAQEVQQKKREEFEAEKVKEQADAVAAEQAKRDKFASKKAWTLAELQDAKMRDEYFVGDCARNEKGEDNRELLLADEEFKSLFGMDKAAFDGLAAWKKKDAKKKHNIF